MRLAVTGAFALLWAVSAAGGPASVSPRQILRLSESAVATSGVQAVRGVVTFVSGIESNRFVLAPQEQPWHQGVAVLATSGVELPQPGDLVLATGGLGWRDGGALVLANAVDVLRNEPLEAPRHVKQADYRRGILAGRRIELEGIVRDVRVILAEGRPVTELMLLIDNYTTVVRVPDPVDAGDWRDEPVTAVGVVRSQLGEGGKFLDAWLEVADLGDVRRLRDDRIPPALLAAAAAFGGVLSVAAVVFLFLWMRGRRKRREMEVIAAERRRMAADLHDTIEQHLAGANLIAAGVMSLGDASPDVLEAMRTLTGLLANAKAEVRSAVMSLRSAGDSRRTLAEAIAEMARSLEKTGIHARRCLRGLPESLPEGVFRDIELILREATTNAVKHGKAANVAFTSDPLGESGFVLRVLNDGRPFDIGRALGPETGHYGISGMKERALRNRLDILWGEDRGWTYMELRSEGK